MAQPKKKRLVTEFAFEEAAKNLATTAQLSDVTQKLAKTADSLTVANILERMAVMEALLNTPTRVPDSPQNLAYTVTGTSVTLTWDPPTNSGSSPVTEYVGERDGLNSNGIAGSPISTGTTRSFTQNNLFAGGTYNFTVRAKNAVGLGRAATITVVLPGAFSSRHSGSPLFTEKLAAVVPIADTSEDFKRRLRNQFYARTEKWQSEKGVTTTLTSKTDPPYNTKVDVGEYAIAVYNLTGKEERIKIAEIPQNAGVYKRWTDPITGEEKTMQSILDSGIPFPDVTTPGLNGSIAPEGNDGSAILIWPNDKGGYYALEGWRFRPLTEVSSKPNATEKAREEAAYAAGYRWACTQAGFMADIRYHHGNWSASGSGNNPSGGDIGCSATGLSYLGMILTGEDWAKGVIDHPLSLSLPMTGTTPTTNRHILPATRSDTFDNLSPASLSSAQFANNRLPEGTQFRWDPAIWTPAKIKEWALAKGRPSDSQNAPAATLEMIMTAAVNYGIYITDSSGVIGASAEHNKTFGTPYNPYSTTQRPDWGDWAAVLPFDEEGWYQVAPPTSQYHIPGEGFTSKPAVTMDFSRAVRPTSGTTTWSTDFSVLSPWGIDGVENLGGNAAVGRTDASGAFVKFRSGIAPYTCTFLAFRKNCPVSADQRARVTFASPSTMTTDSPGAVVRHTLYDGGSSSLTGRWSPTSGGQLQIIETTWSGTASTSTVVATAAQNTCPDWVEIRAIGTTITVWIPNGSSAAVSYITDKITDGRVGFSLRPTATGGESVRIRKFECLDDAAAVVVPPVTETPVVTDPNAVPAWSYGLKDNTGAFVRKDVYLPDPTAGNFTRSVISGDFAAASSGWNYAAGGGTYTSNDTTNFLRGDRSAKVVTAGTAAVNTIQRGITATDLSKGKIIRLLVYISDYTKLDYLGLHLASSGSSTMADSRLRTLDNRFYRNGWQTITFNTSEFPNTSGNYDPTKTNYVKINFRDKGTGSITVNIGGFWVESTAPMTKGAVCFTFDDGGISHYTNAFPILRDEYGFKGTAYIMPGNFGSDPSKMVKTNVQEMAAAGWTIGAHAYSSSTHTGQSATQLAANVKQSKDWITDAVGKSHSEHFAYWDGLDYQSGDIRDVIASNFKFVRNNKGSQISLETQRPSRPVDMRSWLAGSDAQGWTPGDGTNAPVWPGTRASNSAADWIYRTVSGNGLAIFTFHTIGSGGLDLGVFRTFLNQAKAGVDAGALEVLSMEEAALKYGLATAA